MQCQRQSAPEHVEIVARAVGGDIDQVMPVEHPAPIGRNRSVVPWRYEHDQSVAIGGRIAGRHV
jgi:hypothetical protein